LVFLPLELGQLQQLRNLYLNQNKLVDLPPELGQCQQLRILM
jgi:Leucine-rich repeat (LRR) protein